MSKALTVQQERREKSISLSHYLTSQEDKFRELCEVDHGRFMRQMNNAILRDPEIADASIQSVFLECQKAASDGLVLDGREAALVRFKSYKRFKDPASGRWMSEEQTNVTYIPMVAGIIKRVRNSGEVLSWTLGVVYENEVAQGLFKYVQSPEQRIDHEPIMIGDRGDVVAVYSAVRLRDGSYHYEVMRADEINAIMQRTRSKRTVEINGEKIQEITGPWKTDYEEMAKKTVIHRHAKRLPMSSENLSVANRVEGLYDFDNSNTIDGEVVQEQPKKKARPSAAHKLKQAARDLQKQPAQAAGEDAEEAPANDEPSPENESKAIEGDIVTEDGEVISKADEKPASNFNPKDDF